jgi:quaternary ammonium compound-resistance protein SugE
MIDTFQKATCCAPPLPLVAPRMEWIVSVMMSGFMKGSSLWALFDKMQYRRRSMTWIYLFLAGLLEIGWAVGLKYTEGFTKLWPSIATVTAMIASIGLLGLSLRTLPLGTAYAVWTGIGTAGTVILGILLFSEPVTPLRLGCIALIIVGVIGLRVLAPH